MWDDVPFLSVGRIDGHAAKYLIRSHGLADFYMTEDGSQVDVLPRPGASRERIDEVFDQLIRPGIDQLAGTPAIHASALATPVGTVAFLGPSGAGKSTLAALLSKRWPLVADDYLPLSIDGESVIARPSSTWVRVRGATADHVGEVGTPRAGKLAVERPSASEPRPLCRIYAIGESADAVEITRCSRRDGFALVASQLHRLDTQSAALLEAELSFIEKVTSYVQLRILRYPRSFDAMPRIEQAIEADLTPPESP